MTAVEFLTYLRELDIQVYLEGERLRCNAPAGVLTPQLSAQIAKYKPELISLLHAQVKQPQLVKVSRDRSLPLSFAQQRLWFLEQLVPGNAFYNIPAAIRLQGNLDCLALQQAFGAIVQRHEALRTNFLKVNGQPTQIIANDVNVYLPVVDLQHLPAKERQSAAAQIATEEAGRSFNLANDLLLRVKLLQLDTTEYVVLLNLHHIASDGWSLGILMRELGALYTAFSSGTSPLPELPIQYADFACWQREYLQGEVLETQLAYWKSQLADLPILNLPTDRIRPAVQTYRGATHNLLLSNTLTASLEALSQQAGVTLFMTLLAAFQTLLHRYTGQDDIAVGSPIANRNRSELEPLIGFFVNSLVLRVNLADNPTFRELLERVREVTLAAYDYQDLPFEKLVEELHPERDLSRNPLFQVVFALQNAPMQPLELPGLKLQPLKFDVTTTRFDLELHLWQSGYGLSGLWEEELEGVSGFIAYNTDLFDARAIARFTTHFQTLLAGIVANPDTRIADLPLLSAAERHQLIVEWNQTQVNYPNKLFHQLFTAQATKTPDAVAVVCGNEQITYQELDRRANQLAHYLQQLGVAPEILVGICIERSIEMVVGVLGILKAGGAYVPLDPDYPSSRLEFILADTQIAIALTQKSLTTIFPAEIQTICLDTDWDTIATYTPETPTSSVTVDNLAYVIYTSGSTGKPKGVLIEHRGLCNVVAAQIQVLNLQPENRVLQFSSLNFDASIFEMLLAFGVGASLYIPPQTARLPGAEFVTFLQDKAIDTAILPPAVLAVLPEAELPALKTVIAGGEACSQEVSQQWAVDRSFFNAYGPTETTIWATVARLDIAQKPYIGRPVANTQVYLLCDRLQPVPVGVIGEIYIGGDGLARGYLNRPDLTQERFIANPFVETLHATSLQRATLQRLYRTGDRARYLPDGNLEIIGRSDEQIKIRGFRIELGEIEALLNQHPLVRSAIAIANEQRIIAYIVPEKELPQLQTEQIQQWQNLYNQTYSQPAANSDATFNIIGWNSSYTKQPIPATGMQQWVKNRVSQILALLPQRVLEIGCGTGLLLFQIAPHCSQYVGTDFSSASIQYIEQQLAIQPLPQVKLQQKMANDFTDLAENSFDAVILNSVVQYFPSIDYLLQVLEQAINTVAPGGFVFIGDVRNLSLLSAFHAAVQLYQADSDVSREQLYKQVKMAMFQETELAIAPEFFQALKLHFERISHVQVQLTRGRSRNELTQFRYNVILHIDAEKGAEEACCQFNWTQDNLNFAAVRQYLEENQPDILRISAIPNDRVLAAVTTAQWLTDETAPRNAGQIRDALLQVKELGVEPEDWYSLVAELPYIVEVSWLNTDSTGCYDVVFQHKSLKQSDSFLEKQISNRPWETYANNPLQAQFTRNLTPQLQNYLEQNLPKYMIPSALVILEQFPLTPNGKINRPALPAPDFIELDSKSDTAPRSPIEQKLANIWADLLALKNIGIHDNFFHLGGHSLLATQLTSRIRDTFGVELPLQSIFETPQIAQIASAIANLQSRQVQQQAGIVPLSRDAHRRRRSSFDNTGR